MIALFDSDVICYKVGFACQEEEDLSWVLQSVDSFIKQRIDAIYTLFPEDKFTGECEFFLTDSKGNFRLQLYPDYKANRKDFVKPRWYGQIREHLVSRWGAQVAERLEADDYCAMMQTYIGHDKCILVHEDKDLDQLYGHHMNMRTMEYYYIEPYEAMINLYTQWLTGDRVDNIPGVDGIGKSKAHKLFSECKNEQEVRALCLDVLGNASEPNVRVAVVKNKPVYRQIKKPVEQDTAENVQVQLSIGTNCFIHLMALYLLRTPEEYQLILTQPEEEWIEFIKNKEVLIKDDILS